MVSLRCKLMVQSVLDEMGINCSSIELGIIETEGAVSFIQRQQIKKALLSSGLELLDDKKSVLIEQIKNVIIQMVHYTDEPPVINYSAFISNELHYDYTYLANIFSEVKGITIQQYIILHKIEKVKELLLYDELSLTEIYYKLNYSSVAHLSAQFKKTTGLTPTFFKRLSQKRRVGLENV